MKTLKTIALISIVSVGATSSVFASIDKNLKYGQRDKEVTELQEFLIDKGLLKTTPSNFFGLLTLRAVKAYQTSVGVSSTGFVGALTREKINKEIDAEIASSNEAERVESTVTTNTPQINNQAVTNQNTTIASSDSIYDSNVKFDKLGRKVTITQDPNYKFLNIVRAKVDIGGDKILTGFFYKNTKTFMTEEEISLQQSITDDQLKKKALPEYIAPTTNQTVQSQRIQVQSTKIDPSTVSYIPPDMSNIDIKIVNSPYGARFTTNDTVSFEVRAKDSSGNYIKGVEMFMKNTDGLSQGGWTAIGNDYYPFRFTPTKSGIQTVTFDIPSRGLKKDYQITIDEFVPIPPVVTFIPQNVSEVYTTKSRISAGYIQIDQKNQRIALKNLKYSILSSECSISDIAISMSGNTNNNGIIEPENRSSGTGGLSIAVLGSTKPCKFKIKIDEMTLISNYNGNLNENNIPVNVDGFVTNEISIIQ